MGYVGTLIFSLDFSRKRREPMPGRGDEGLPAVILQPAIAPGFAGELDGGYIQERLEFAEGRRIKCSKKIPQAISFQMETAR